METEGLRMRTLTKAAAIGGGLLAGWIAWGLYAGRSAETVPYEVRETFEDVEIRQYPRTVVAETTARNEMTAFRRLFDYITGSNEGRESVSMTAPVKTVTGQSISMTAPVRSESTGEGELTRMAFYLPAEYDIESAPEPTDADVELREEPARTLAVIEFSWYAPDWRVRAYCDRLRSVLDSEGIEMVGESFLLRYDDPGTPPFMRRNEVGIEVEPPEA
ncbi:SOUL heme-binding protein [Halodesulfurarchaeum formicicum]|uniref:SOUL heme-binding protein n=2 Tax=Halodesulfurarchaeum formicicum TaxID=1873524 RepID=A0A1D8S511_9EURY|nr:SOUL heme-binding protein [Halodesulfurarchaeum formicicum]